MNISEMAAAMGRIRTPKKAASSAANLADVIARRKANANPCNCGRSDGTHASVCAAYSRWRARERAKNKLQK